MDNLDWKTSGCHVCMSKFDDEASTPFYLPCTHAFCGSCLTQLTVENMFVCPICGKYHTASSVIDLKYFFEELFSEDGDVVDGKTSACAPEVDSSDRSNSRSVKNRSENIIQEQKDSLTVMLKSSEKTHADILKYKVYVEESRESHKNLIEMLEQITSQHRDMVKTLDAEKKKLGRILESGQRVYVRVSAYLTKLEKLKDVANFCNVITLSDKLENAYDSLKGWNDECRAKLPSAQTIKRSDELVKKTAGALGPVSEEEEQAKVLETVDLSLSTLSIMEKVDLLHLNILSFNCLRTMLASGRDLIGSEHGVYCVQRRDGIVRSSNITIRGDMICFHYLRDENPPHRAFTIVQSELIGGLNMDSVTAFLDLAWEGIIHGRIHIQLAPDTPFARHFRMLCTGEQGPCYARSKFLNVRDKGNKLSESVVGGDYENNNGSGGAPLFSGLNTRDSVYHRKYTEGALVTAHHDYDGQMSAQFSIVTGTGKEQDIYGMFGQVHDGLDVLRAAVELSDIQLVTIADCGVVLPL